MATPDLDRLIGKSEKPVIVVAHPDDEVLWCAGLPIRYPGKDWLIICSTTPVKDPIRADKFLDACDVLNASGLVIARPENVGLIEKQDLSERDLVISHGPRGEYGHPQHRELHQLYKPDLWFAYGDQSDVIIALSDNEWQQKLAAIRCYDHYSPADDGKRKSEALIDYYGKRYDLRREPYGLSDARKNGEETSGNPST